MQSIQRKKRRASTSSTRTHSTRSTSARASFLIDADALVHEGSLAPHIPSSLELRSIYFELFLSCHVPFLPSFSDVAETQSYVSVRSSSFVCVGRRRRVVRRGAGELVVVVCCLCCVFCVSV